MNFQRAKARSLGGVKYGMGWTREILRYEMDGLKTCG